MSDCGMNVDECVALLIGYLRQQDSSESVRLSEGLGPPALSKTWNKPCKITRKGQM